ncbi:RmlC-like cupin domain-containing protein [Leptodontidium sp. MPI-SDFR-AT-0119]|nr:RmlC-like cupin domain-containing protein [Leptodontidium sp. MPI-SDFR-AT-0119]
MFVLNWTTAVFVALDFPFGFSILSITNLYFSVMTALPHTSSAIHHHGEQDTIVYAASGHGAIISDNGKTRQELAPGDFALIPAWTEHQEVNDGEEEVTWIITRSGGEPVVVNLKGWGKGTKE